MASSIFISYRRSDQAKAELLHHLLKERGVDSWYDALLGAGEDWRTKTAQALVDAPIFVLLFSKNAAQSDDIIKELSAATFQKKTVIPVRIEDIHPEGAFLYELASRNWFDAFKNTEARFAILADQLAGLVHGGQEAKAAAAKLGAAVPLPPKKTKNSGPLILGVVGIVAAAIVAIVWSGLNSPDDDGRGSGKGGGYRTAFFGFTPTGDDPAAAGAADIATEEAFRLLDLLKVDTISRLETAAAREGAVFERAGELGGRFALSGDIRREGEMLKATIRVMDVPSRTTIAQVAGQRRADKPGQIAYTMGAVAARTVACIESYIASDDAAVDAEALALMGRACVTDLNDASTSYRELMQKRPKNWMAPARLADSLVWRLAQLPQAQRPAAITEAEAAVKRAEEMAPDSYSTALARVSFAVVRNERPIAWLPRLEEVLARAPTPKDALAYAQASGNAGQQAMELGRIKDAARYFSQAVISDPTYANLVYYRSVAQAASGQFGAKDTLDGLVETRVNGYTWEIALTAAIFLNATDPEIVLAAAPPDVKDVIPCYRDLIASLKSTNRQARLAGAKRADVCLTAFDSPHVNMQAQSMLGDLDRAFEVFDRPDFTAFMWNYWSPIFMPSTKAMRADPRFLPAAEKLGFVDYWKQTKTHPDVCDTAEERDIPVCVALREP